MAFAFVAMTLKVAPASLPEGEAMDVLDHMSRKAFTTKLTKAAKFRMSLRDG